MERELRIEYEALKADYEIKLQELHRREKEVRRAGKEYDTRAAKLTAELDLKARGEQERLRNEHILEMQVMLLEFEKAKNFLKKEIEAKSLQ